MVGKLTFFKPPTASTGNEPSLTDAANLIALMGRHLNPMVSRSMDLRTQLLKHHFTDPDATLSYLIQSGLVIEDEPSVYKLGKTFSWLNPKRLLARESVPSVGKQVVQAVAVVESESPVKSETNLRFGRFLERLRSLLAGGGMVPLKGTKTPTNLATDCKIYGSVGSVLVSYGYLRREGQQYAALPGLATLTVETLMEHVSHYVKANKNQPKPVDAPLVGTTRPTPAEPAAPVSKAPSTVRPKVSAKRTTAKMALPGYQVPSYLEKPLSDDLGTFTDDLISDVTAVLIESPASADQTVYQSAKPVFTSGIVPRDSEFVVIFPENVQFFPSEAVALCFAENSVLNDGKKSAIVVHLDPAMKRVRKSIETGTL